MRASPLRLLVVHNPYAGNGGRSLFHAVLARLASAGCDVDVAATTQPGDATAAASRAVGYDRIVVVGGDGTFNEVINGIADTTHRPPLAIIPEGTSNVLAAEIGLSRRADRVAEAILRGREVPIALGRVNGRYFSVMVGAGLDAYLVAKVDHALKRRYGAKAYVASFVRQLREFPFPDYDVSIDGASRVARSVIVANASRYARHWKVAPRADIRDDHLDVCHVRARGRLGTALALFGGRLAEGRGLAIRSGSQIRIDGPAGDPVQADGDIVTTLPAEIIVRPAAVNVLYPP